MNTLKTGIWVCASCARRQASVLPQLRSFSPRRIVTPTHNPRSFHSSSTVLDSSTQRQAVPLGDFYTDLLATPIPKQNHSLPALPTFVQSGDDSKEARARKLFGTMERYHSSNSKDPDETWRTINGVPVPPRPAEPDNCCMSGCVHCVWDDYRDEVESWAHRLQAAQSKAPKRAIDDAIKINMPRAEVSEASGSMDDDGGGSEGLWDSPASTDGDTLFKSLPVGIREFMATEKKLREKKKAKRERAP